MSAFGEASDGICVSLWSTSFWVRSRCVSDVMCSVCYVSQQNSCSCVEPLGTCVYVFVLLYVCVCVYMWKGQTALYHCHSQRQRKTLMLFHTDTYLTPLSLTLTLLQADIVCVLVCRTVTSHQTMAPKLSPKAHSSPPQSFFSFLTQSLLFLFFLFFP